ncbi:hypothetical protein [Gordonia sp. NPDC058843]|uniref:hypothetical protein n=1 Tax=Gordonia sp. NPDC058843 TaxID=3346648 RepID=UPI0036BC3958
MKKTTARVLLCAAATGVLFATAPVAEAATYPDQKQCLDAAKREGQARHNAGDMLVPTYGCKAWPDGSGWYTTPVKPAL